MKYKGRMLIITLWLTVGKCVRSISVLAGVYLWKNSFAWTINFSWGIRSAAMLCGVVW